MFRWKDVVAASRFQQKMWSIVRFSLPHITDLADAGDGDGGIAKDSLTIVDLWVLGRLNRLIADATDAMERYQFDLTLKMIRSFAWEILADHYIELVKYRLYGEQSPDQDAARWTLGVVIDSLARLIAPITPFFAEEVRSYLHPGESVHAAAWPTVDESMIDPTIDFEGERIRNIAWAIRRYKSEHGIALNAPLKGIEIYAGTLFDCLDIAGAANTPVQVTYGTPDFEHRAVGVKPDMKVLGPIFRKEAGKIIGALSEIDPGVIAEQAAIGTIKVEIGADVFEIPADAVTIEREVVLGGRAVDVVEAGGAIVVITR
jgi:valyl-tRNA synthetase